MALAHGALFDVLHRVRHVDDAFDVDARRDDVVGVDIARLHQVLDLRDGDFPGGRHHRIEVTRGLSIDEIAFGIGHPGMHDRQIGNDAPLHDVALAVELAFLFALGDVGAGTGAGKESRNARARRRGCARQACLAD